jgi:peptide/nickel transport system substrate-binding protein
MAAISSSVMSARSGALKIQSLPFKEWDAAVCYGHETAVLDNIYERLLFYDAVGRIRPVLATSWESSDHGRVWTFHLRSDVFFHNGERFDAKAVKFSVERTKRLGRGPAWVWNEIRKIDVTGELRVEFHCTRPLPLDLIAAGRYGAYMVSPKNHADSDGAGFQFGHAVGTGPYCLEGVEADGSIYLVRNERYWAEGTDRPYKTVIYKPVLNVEHGAAMLENGDLDIGFYPPREKTDAWSDCPDITCYFDPTITNRMYMFNHRRPPTDDRQVRLAIRQALDIPDLVARAYGSFAVPATGPLPSLVWSHIAGKPQAGGDPAMARETLLGSRHSRSFVSGPVEITMANTHADFYTTAVHIKEALTPVGFDVKIESRVKPVQLGSPLETAHLIPVEWTPTYITPSDWLINLFSTNHRWNQGGYSNTEFDRAVSTGYLLEGRNREKSRHFYETGQQLLIDDVAGLFICDARMVTACRTSVHNLKLYPAYTGTVFANELAMAR